VVEREVLGCRVCGRTDLCMWWSFFSVRARGGGRFLWVRVWRRADVLGGGEVRGRADPVLVEGGEQAPCAEERRKVVLHVGQVDFSFFSLCGAGGEPNVQTRC